LIGEASRLEIIGLVENLIAAFDEVADELAEVEDESPTPPCSARPAIGFSPPNP
jgi:hypothetical protein